MTGPDSSVIDATSMRYYSRPMVSTENWRNQSFSSGLPSRAPIISRRAPPTLLNRSGILDFHASRVSYINILLDRGVGVREAQTLARHSTPQMTMNVYGRPRQEDLSAAISAMAKSVLGEKKRATCVQQPAAGSERQSATPSTTEGCASSNLAPAVGLEPIPPLLQNQTHPLHNLYIFMQNPHSRIA